MFRRHVTCGCRCCGPRFASVRTPARNLFGVVDVAAMRVVPEMTIDGRAGGVLPGVPLPNSGVDRSKSLAIGRLRAPVLRVRDRRTPRQTARAQPPARKARVRSDMIPGKASGAVDSLFSPRVRLPGSAASGRPISLALLRTFFAKQQNNPMHSRKSLISLSLETAFRRRPEPQTSRPSPARRAPEGGPSKRPRPRPQIRPPKGGRRRGRPPRRCPREPLDFPCTLPPLVAVSARLRARGSRRPLLP
jgi:hypothetical protein